MKVSELKIGMMVRPIINKWTSKRMNLKVQQIVTYKSHDAKEPMSTALMCDVACSSPAKGIRNPNVGIYMGFKHSDYWMMGVKKHHQLLVGDTLTSFSGYDVRYLEAVGNNESKE